MTNALPRARVTQHACITHGHESTCCCASFRSRVQALAERRAWLCPSQQHAAHTYLPELPAWIPKKPQEMQHRSAWESDQKSFSTRIVSSIQTEHTSYSAKPFAAPLSSSAVCNRSSSEPSFLGFRVHRAQGCSAFRFKVEGAQCGVLGFGFWD